MAVKQLVEKRNEHAAKQKKLADIFTEGRGPAGSNDDLDLDLITSLKGTSQQKMNEIRKLNEELDAIGEEVDALAIVEQAARNLEMAGKTRLEDPDSSGKPKARFNGDDDFEQTNGRQKGIGDLFVESDIYKRWKPGSRGVVSGEIEKGLVPLLKTDFTTSAGWAPESVRTGRVIEEQLRPIQVIDTVPGGTTGQAAIVYMEETTVTNNAAERNEAAAYAESALALTEQTNTVRSIGTSLPVTDEQLADVNEVRSYLNMRLGFLVRQRLDGQILTGDGAAPNLRGFNNLVTVQTQAKGADPVPDAVMKAMTLVRVTGRSIPSVVYFHPNDWQGVRLLRTTEGIYIWGNPSEAGPLRIWGVTVVETDAQTENTALAGDVRNFTQLFIRQNLTVEVGFVNDDLLKGLQTFRVGMRAALVGYRPQAFCTVTGI